MVDPAPLLILSVEYHHQDLNSDKQFIRDLVEQFALRRRVVVLSISGCTPYDVDYRDSGSNSRIVNINRLFHKPSSHFSDPLKPHCRHSSARNLVELYSTIRKNRRTIERLVRSEGIGVIHVTDQVGPIVSMLRRMERDLTLTIAKPTARLFSRSLRGAAYGQLVRLNYSRWDAVVPYTSACARQLKDWGVRTPSRVIHWGVKEPTKIETNIETPPEKYFVVTDREITSSDPVGLVALVTSLSKAIDMPAILPIRRSRYSDELAQLSNPHVTVESSDDAYYAKLGNAEFLFCPNSSHRETSLIPLVWLEAMQRRVPVVTKDCPGASEAITSLENGLLYNDPKSLIDQGIHELLDRRNEISKRCESTVATKFRVADLANQYQECWTEQ